MCVICKLKNKINNFLEKSVFKKNTQKSVFFVSLQIKKSFIFAFLIVKMLDRWILKGKKRIYFFCFDYFSIIFFGVAFIDLSFLYSLTLLPLFK